MDVDNGDILFTLETKSPKKDGSPLLIAVNSTDPPLRLSNVIIIWTKRMRNLYVDVDNGDILVTLETNSLTSINPSLPNSLQTVTTNCESDGMSKG